MLLPSCSHQLVCKQATAAKILGNSYTHSILNGYEAQSDWLVIMRLNIICAKVYFILDTVGVYAFIKTATGIPSSKFWPIRNGLPPLEVMEVGEQESQTPEIYLPFHKSCNYQPTIKCFYSFIICSLIYVTVYTNLGWFRLLKPRFMCHFLACLHFCTVP